MSDRFPSQREPSSLQAENAVLHARLDAIEAALAEKQSLADLFGYSPKLQPVSRLRCVTRVTRW